MTLSPLRGPKAAAAAVEEADVVVVGFGAAGASAAIEAADAGADVLVLERFAGGGATARSGGIVYLGGGTRLQRAAGYEDDPHAMLQYLRQEVGDAVGERTLRAFCDQSLATLAWLEGLGVPFPIQGWVPVKTSYPDDACTLYFSGNELVQPYLAAAPPAPRGHRVLGRGLTCHTLFAKLRVASVERGVRIWSHSSVRGLLRDRDGRVVGVQVSRLGASRLLRGLHGALCEIGASGSFLSRGLGRLAATLLARLEARFGKPTEVRARKAVILCAGGFVHNREMMREYATPYARCAPLGTPGDDGRGIQLGLEAGGRVERMDRCCAWRFINPPEAFTRGVLVDAEGHRICNEELYGAKLGEHISDRPAARAFLVIDASIAQRVRQELRDTKLAPFQKLTAYVNLRLNRRKAASLAELARRCGMPPAALEGTIRAYNTAAAGEGPDAQGKAPRLLQRIAIPPFHAIDCSLGSRGFPAPCLTLGGLVVEGSSGRVLGDGRTPIAGLYAAGRNAVGVSSQSYVSGLSLADCIFSGRLAGRHAAARPALTRSGIPSAPAPPDPPATEEPEGSS